MSTETNAAPQIVALCYESNKAMRLPVNYSGHEPFQANLDPLKLGPRVQRSLPRVIPQTVACGVRQPDLQKPMLLCRRELLLLKKGTPDIFCQSSGIARRRTS